MAINMRSCLKIAAVLGIFGILLLPSFAVAQSCLLSISSGEPYWEQVIDPVSQKTFIEATTINAHTVEPEELLPHPTYAPFVWLTKDKRGLIFNSAFFNNIYPVSVKQIGAGQEVYLTTLNDRSFSSASARDIALFLIRSDLINAHGAQFPNTTNADFCLDNETDNEHAYAAHFSGRFLDYCTNECKYGTLDFSIRMNKNTGAVHVLGVQNHAAPPSSSDKIPWEQIGFGIGFASVFFIYLALALRSLAQKYNTPRRCRAWVPLAQWFLLVDIAGKPQIWKHYIFLPLVGLFTITLGMIWAIFAALAFFLWQIMLALCIAAIAQRQKRPLPLVLGLAAAFAQPIGAIILGVLAWSKPPPNSLR